MTQPNEESFRAFVGGYAQKRYVVEQYQDALGDLVGDAIRAGAFEDCVQAVDTLYPYLVKGGAERLAVTTGVLLVALAQAWQREGRLP